MYGIKISVVDSQIGVPFSFKAIVCLPAIGEELVPSFTCCLIIRNNVEDDLSLTTWQNHFFGSLSLSMPSMFQARSTFFPGCTFFYQICSRQLACFPGPPKPYIK